MDACHYTLHKPTEYKTPRVNPKVSYRLWIIIMHSCKIIIYNKCTTLLGDIGNGGNYASRSQKVYWKYLYISLNFTVTPEPL